MTKMATTNNGSWLGVAVALAIAVIIPAKGNVPTGGTMVKLPVIFAVLEMKGFTGPSAKDGARASEIGRKAVILAVTSRSLEAERKVGVAGLVPVSVGGRGT